MRISRTVRKAALAAHTASSVAWLGAAVVLLVLISGVLTGDLDPAAAYPSAARVGNVVVVPLSLLALATGILLAWGTPWGFFRHWWVTVKLVTTVAMTLLVLVLLRPALNDAADMASALTPDERVSLVIGPSVSTTLLTVNLVLSVYRPGRRRAQSKATPDRAATGLARG